VREVYKDDDATWRSVVPAAINLALSIAKRGLIFPGTRRMQEYPLAKDIGGICCPNGGGISSWGFGCYHPVLFYGSSPLKGAHPTMKVIYHPGMHVTGEDWIDHPCPKPISFMRWAIERGSIQNETILDPFMGSGTTLRAAKDLGRKAIGIEIEEKYVKIAIERLRQEVLKL
jgi:DNA modification methylase